MTNPGVNALRTPVFAEMVNIVNSKPVDFAEYKFKAATVESMFSNFVFNNVRPITKSMAAWWAFNDAEQKLLPLDMKLDIEHIYASARLDKESLMDADNIESLGNKSLLERRINIRASDYKFGDKKKYYLGHTNRRGQKMEGTKIVELEALAKKNDDFTEDDIVNRRKRIMDAFINYLSENDLIAQ